MKGTERVFIWGLLFMVTISLDYVPTNTRAIILTSVKSNLFLILYTMLFYILDIKISLAKSEVW